MLRLSSIYFKTTPAVMVMTAKMMPLLSAAERSEVDALRNRTPLTAHYLLLATLATLATHFSLLTTHYSPLTTH